MNRYELEFEIYATKWEPNWAGIFVNILVNFSVFEVTQFVVQEPEIEDNSWRTGFLQPNEWFVRAKLSFNAENVDIDFFKDRLLGHRKDFYIPDMRINVEKVEQFVNPLSFKRDIE